jgi:Fe-S oxidoreductase
VLLWPDTFNNYLTPEVARDATEVLESAGYDVVLPRKPVCCGLTWITTGQLATAKRVLRHTLRVMRPVLDAGIPIVSLEPSCTAVFRNDLPELLPDHPDATRLAGRVHTLAEFLTTQASDWSFPRLNRRAIAQPHCHQHAVLGTDADQVLLARLGVDADTLSGCCGLAGNFGFERGHYQVSKAVAENRLLPALREAAPDTLVLADGFSCRTQIIQETDHRPLHLAQVLRSALNEAEGSHRT